MTFSWIFYCLFSSMYINTVTTNLCYHKLKRKSQLIIFLYATLVQSLLPPYLQGTWTNIVIFFGIYIFVIAVQRHPFLNLIGILLNYILGVCINYIFIATVYLLGLTLSDITGSFAIYAIYCVILTLFMELITGNLGKLYRKLLTEKILPLLQTQHYRKFLYLVSAEILVCGFVFVLNVIAGNYIGYSTPVLIFNGVLFLILFLSTAIIFYHLYKTMRDDYNLRIKVAEADVLAEYTSRLEGLYQEIRTFKHDYINILSSLYAYTEEGKYQELKEYLEHQIIPEGKKLAATDAMMGKLGNLKILELKGILYMKVLKASLSGLQVTVDIPAEVNELQMGIPDLVRVLGILLDNALEAAILTQEKLFYVGILSDDNWSYIRISNSSPSIDNIASLCEANYSSKESHMGLGLYEVNQIIQKYDNVYLNTEYEKDQFIQQLHIQNQGETHAANHSL